MVNKLIILFSFLALACSPLLVEKNVQTSLSDGQFEEVQALMFSAARLDSLLENHTFVGRDITVYDDALQETWNLKEYITPEGYGRKDSGSSCEISKEQNPDVYQALMEENLFGISKNEKEEILSAGIYDDELRIKSVLDLEEIRQDFPQLSLDDIKQGQLYCIYSLDALSYELNCVRVFEEDDQGNLKLRICMQMSYDCTDPENYLGE